MVCESYHNGVVKKHFPLLKKIMGVVTRKRKHLKRLLKGTIMKGGKKGETALDQNTKEFHCQSLYSQPKHQQEQFISLA